MSDGFPMTQAGYAALKEELRRLKSVDRPEVILAIAEARAHGDLSENAEYAAAREKQSWIEARIKLVEDRVGRAQVIDTSKLSGDRVILGATVTILDYESDTQQVWTLVGDEESNLEERKVGISSPIARALIGKVVGDEVEIRTPKGKKECEVVKVAFK